MSSIALNVSNVRDRLISRGPSSKAAKTNSCRPVDEHAWACPSKAFRRRGVTCP